MSDPEDLDKFSVPDGIDDTSLETDPEKMTPEKLASEVCGYCDELVNPWHSEDDRREIAMYLDYLAGILRAAIRYNLFAYYPMAIANIVLEKMTSEIKFIVEDGIAEIETYVEKHGSGGEGAMQEQMDLLYEHLASLKTLRDDGYAQKLRKLSETK